MGRGYKGKTEFINMGEGGLVGDVNIDTIESQFMVYPTRNINLHRNGRESRGGTSYVYSDNPALGTTTKSLGLYDFTLKSGKQFIINASKAGTTASVYRDGYYLIKSGMGIANFFCFETFKNELYIADGLTTMQTWDGSATSTSDITTPADDWTGSNHPGQILKHGRGQSERLWALRCPNNLKRIYGSADSDGKDWSSDNVFIIDIDVPDPQGIVGAIEFGDRLLLFGKRQAYLLDDDDTDSANWGYEGAQWYGGVANWKLLVRAPNDVVAMMDDGNIYSVVTTQKTGDYEMGSLTKDSFMSQYIIDHIDLSRINEFHAVYDPTLRAIKFFVARIGQSLIDTALVYFGDRDPKEAWTIHGAWTNSSGYRATASCIVREPTQKYRVYTGDTSGKIWKLNMRAKNDNDKAYHAGFKTPKMAMGNPRTHKVFSRGIISLRPKGNFNMLCDWWVDGVKQAQKTISMDDGGDTLGPTGSFTLGTSKLSGTRLHDVVFPLGNKGRFLQMEIYNATVNEEFFVSQLMVDYRTLGKRPS